MSGTGNKEAAVIVHPHAVQVKVPLPFPLRWVNGYLLQGAQGWTLIDPGLRTEAAEQLWREALGGINISMSEIEQIVLTHHHPDHYGLAGWFQQQTGAPVRMSRKGWEQAQHLWGANQKTGKLQLELFASHGLPPEMMEAMAQHLDSFLELVSPHPKPEFIAPDTEIRLGDALYAVIETGGHAEGHLSFYNQESGVIFCGDHVLPRISPNVSYMPEGDSNPLASYISGLERVKDLPVAMAYPGHRDPFAQHAERAAELQRHHEERLDAMLSLLSEPLTAYEVSQAVFGGRLSFHQLRFALSETIAHLIWLREQGKAAEAVDEDGKITYLCLKKE